MGRVGTRSARGRPAAGAFRTVRWFPRWIMILLALTWACQVFAETEWTELDSDVSAGSDDIPVYDGARRTVMLFMEDRFHQDERVRPGGGGRAPKRGLTGPGIGAIPCHTSSVT